MTCHRVPMSPSLCTCGAVLDITVWHGDDELGNPLCPTCSGCGCEPNERNERVSVPTDTPSTDGAPDPEEVRIEPTFHKRTPDRWTIEVIGLAGIRMFSVEATGPDDEVAIAWANEMADLVFRPVVPEDRPAQCPNCGSTDPRKVGIRPASPLTGDGAYSVAFSEVCSDPWHAPAGVPALDDDTRREVPEVLLTFAKWADWYLEDGCRRDHHGYCQAHGLDKDCPVGPMREWLAAYLGGTDGR